MMLEFHSCLGLACRSLYHFCNPFISRSKDGTPTLLLYGVQRNAGVGGRGGDGGTVNQHSSTYQHGDGNAGKTVSLLFT